MNSFEENNLFENIQQGDEKAFEKLFKLYYGYLCNFATKLINDDVAAEEIVQDLFVKFWERRADLKVETSLKNYLFRSVKNLCLNHIKHSNIKLLYAQKMIAESEINSFNNDYIEVDLAADIAKSIEELPEKRREIFRLSREEGLKYREIAEKLNISIKTVEAQISLAIKSLRDKLNKYNTFIFYFFVSRTKNI
ncbi:RNA polymerase sigma-70 factor [Draconibacterium mangrovi]|uniref:RNA polymerase sigma-70 factor n=1 Tax=Draconibacterium mangrovi TaxID=2697469 RepID=UPI0013D5C41C|nr:RNA polymerase sigma-70 factor [Draconibacterium mangrovi]